MAKTTMSPACWGVSPPAPCRSSERCSAKPSSCAGGAPQDICWQMLRPACKSAASPPVTACIPALCTSLRKLAASACAGLAHTRPARSGPPNSAEAIKPPARRRGDIIPSPLPVNGCVRGVHLHVTSWTDFVHQNFPVKKLRKNQVRGISRRFRRAASCQTRQVADRGTSVTIDGEWSSLCDRPSHRHAHRHKPLSAGALVQVGGHLPTAFRFVTPL